MPSYRTGEVVTLLEARPGLQRVEVDLGHGPERAYALTQLTGPVALGDRVVVNTTAVELGLGTGGWHVVHWNLERDGWSEPGPGHIIKGRYTSLQADVGSTEEHLEALAEIDSIDGMPVVVAALHSQLPAVAVAFKACAPDARLAYVMTDGAGLPLALSDLVATLRAKDLIDATVTCGHAFGGDYEAVSVFSALAVARHVAHADAAVIVMGPGIVGTNTRLGFSGMEVGPILDAASASRRRAHRLPAGLVRRRTRPPRRALAPQRDRAAHRRARPGAGRGAARSAIPSTTVACATTSSPPASTVRHDLVDVDAPDVLALFARHDLRIASMGRPAADDPALFQAAAAAGALAAARLPRHATRKTAMADRLERLVNLTATLLETRRPLTPRRALRPRRAPLPGRARRHAGGSSSATRRRCASSASRSGSRPSTASAPSRPTGSTPTTTTCPSSSSPRPSSPRCTWPSPRYASRATPGAKAWPSSAGLAGEGADSPLAQLDVTPGLAVLFDAVSRHAPVTFSYRGDVRHLDPYGVVLRFGHWYVVGHDRDRDAPRAFRVDRIDGERRAGRRRLVHPARGHRPRRVRAGRPHDLRRGPAGRRPRARRRPARRLGGRPARRGGGRRASPRRRGRRLLAGREPRRVPLLGDRPARPRRGARHRPSCAPTWWRGSTRSRAGESRA